MLLYIAGPMRGHTLSNFPAFFSAAMALRGIGHEVTNPAERDMAHGYDPNDTAGPADPADLAAMFVFDFQSIIRASGMVLLPGWEKSEGVAAERVVAKYAGTPCFVYDPSERTMLRAIDTPRPRIQWPDVADRETCRPDECDPDCPGPITTPECPGASRPDSACPDPYCIDHE